MMPISVYQKTEATVTEVVIYKIKKEQAGHLDSALSRVRAVIEELPGFIDFEMLKSRSNGLLFIDMVRWESLKDAREAAIQIQKIIESPLLDTAFEEILIMDHFELFTSKDTKNRNTDMTRIAPTYYTATLSPNVVDLGLIGYLSLKGFGSTKSKSFKDSIEALFAVANQLKFASKSQGRDFVIAPLEAQWWVESDAPVIQIADNEWHWNLLIRIPEFINANQVDEAVQQVIKQSTISLASEVEYLSVNGGKSVQALYVGLHEEKKATLESIQQFIDMQGLCINGYQHEVYITDPFHTQPEQLETIIRYPVK